MHGFRLTATVVALDTIFVRQATVESKGNARIKTVGKSQSCMVSEDGYTYRLRGRLHSLRGPDLPQRRAARLRPPGLHHPEALQRV